MFAALLIFRSQVLNLLGQGIMFTLALIVP
ncbi:hypothetical protein LINPERHAP2_LOCUS402 [Linum perenne]